MIKAEYSRARGRVQMKSNQINTYPVIVIILVFEKREKPLGAE